MAIQPTPPPNVPPNVLDGQATSTLPIPEAADRAVYVGVALWVPILVLSPPFLGLSKIYETWDINLKD